MKEFTKSLFSYSLAITFFGLKQVDNLLSPTPGGERKPVAIKSLDSLTSATAAQFGETLKSGFEAVDNLQRGLVELTFDVIFPFAAFLTRRTGYTQPVWRFTQPNREGGLNVVIVEPPATIDIELAELRTDQHGFDSPVS